MSKEKIIKLQAREALKGNLSILTAALGFIALCVVGLIQLFYLPVISLRVINADTEAVNPGSENLYFIILSVCALLGVFLTPLINGYMRMAGKVAVEGEVRLSELFFFYKSPLRFFKSAVVNMGLTLLFYALTLPLNFLTKLAEGYGEPFLTAALVFGVIWRIFIFLFFIHYPLAAFALDDSRGIVRYLFCYIGFSFRHGGALIRLLFSMLGWIALCFFVVPAIWVIPYLEVSLMNSARWLFLNAH